VRRFTLSFINYFDESINDVYCQRGTGASSAGFDSATSTPEIVVSCGLRRAPSYAPQERFRTFKAFPKDLACVQA
jgi:hypothetical protein